MKYVAVWVAFIVAGCNGSEALDERPVDQAGSTLVVDRATGVVANGVDAALITVTVVDARGQPLQGRSVDIMATGMGNTIVLTAPTDEHGVATGTLTSTVAETKTVTASVGIEQSSPVLLSEQGMVEFIPGAPASLEFIVQPLVVEAGGVLAPAVEVAVVDANGNPILDAAGMIDVELTSASVPLFGTTTVALSGGVASFDDLVIMVPGTGYTLTATSALVGSGMSPPFDVVATPSSVDSTIEFLPSSAVADGFASIEVAATIRNVHGIAVPGHPVSAEMDGAGSDVFPKVGITDAAGRIATSLSSLVAETKTVTVTAGAAVVTGTVMFEAPPCTLLMSGLPSQVLQAAPRSMFVGDLDADGRLDLAIAEPTKLAIMRGLGNGQFKPPVRYASVASSVGIAGGDLDNDGDLDLVIASRDTMSVRVFLGNGDSTFAPAIPLAFAERVRAVAIADFDGDGVQDLVARTDVTVVTLIGLGNGTFQAGIVHTLGLGNLSVNGTVALSDLTNDGKPEIISASTNNTIAVLVNNGSGSFQPAVVTEAQFSPGTVAIADFDGDGTQDVVTAGSSALYFKKGNGNGTLATSVNIGAIGTTYGAVAADFNGDGFQDVATASSGTKVVLGNGDGTFRTPQEYSTHSMAVSLVAADFNGDGRIDLVIGHETFSPALYKLTAILGAADGTFHGSRFFQGTGPNRARFMSVTGDFDGNGTLDFVAGRPNLQQVGIQLAAANGTLTAAPMVTGVSGLEAILGDFDNDGHLDVAIGSLNVVRWLRGNGDGTLQPPVSTDLEGTASIAADLDDDSILDLVALNRVNDTMTVALGIGNGTFSTPIVYPVGVSPGFVIARDLDGDADLDLVVSNGGSASISILKGVGDGTFLPPTDYAFFGGPQMTAVGDLDSDGALDLLVADAFRTEVHFYRGNGDATFEPEVRLQVGSTSFYLEAVDIDADGTLDVVAGPQTFILHGRGDGTFREAIYGSPGGKPTLADYDGDGRIDAMVPVYDSAGAGYAMSRNRACL